MIDHALAAEVMQRIETLMVFSEEPDRLTRRYGSEALRQLYQVLEGWMQAAGMTTRRDNLGNRIGRYEAAQPGAKTLLLGSHVDSVRDAGKYDGPLGVLIALAVVERLHASGTRLPFAIEVVAFADEEGLRFGSSFLCSKAVAGTFEPAMLRLSDAGGITVAEAIRAFGGDPDAIAEDAYDAETLLGYCEVHIEQGPLLEALNLPVGIVTAIQGQDRSTITFSGEAGHAGTVPIHMRRDALCAAAEFVLAVEALAREISGLVATVGQIEGLPGASNVIPGRVTLSLDMRHPDDAQCQHAAALLRERAQAICAARGIELDWQHLHTTPAVQCSPLLMELLAQAVDSLGHPVYQLASGAGHDAGMLATITPVAMLFVRCKGGISHNPAESVTSADVGIAIDVMSRFLELLAEKGATL
ncbi:MAG TPA: allantoate amidohydrolase [Herpetosiphonaceae bacterium]